VLGANRTIGEPPPGVAQVFPLAELDRMLPLCDVVAYASAWRRKLAG